MRRLSTAEMLQLRELLQMESNSLAVTKTIQPLVQDEELNTMIKSGIQASEVRIKGIQQFINEYDLVVEEVH